MDRGLYIAASGMLAEHIRQDQIANDLADAATPGYKRDRTARREFGELLPTNGANGATVGGQSTAVQVDNVETDFSPKPSRDTGEPLDFAITGVGFFGIRTAQGVRYTRNGQFTVSPHELLVTAQGDPVLGRGGRAVRVGDDGRVDPRSLDVVRLENPRKEGDNLVAGTPAGGAGAGQVRAGALEASGSYAARSMVDMIASLRAFEAGQRR
jgi:flagellar basal-body rod protein FlgG